MEYPKDGPVPVEEDIPESISDENIGVHDQDTKEIGAEQHYSDAACLLLALVDTAQPVTPSANNVEHDDMQLALLGDVPPLVDIQNVQPTESGQDHSSMVSAVKPSTPSVYKQLPRPRNKNNALKICCDEIEPQTPLQETSAEAPIGSVKIVVCGKIIPVSTNTLKLIKVFGSGCSGSVLGVTHKTDPDVKIAVKRMVRDPRPEKASMRLNELKMARQIGVSGCLHIIDYYDAMICDQNNELCIFMELMNTTIKEFYECFHQMKEIPPGTIDRFLCHLSHAIASALEFLANLGYLHGDVKPSNVLINNGAVIKLCDLGTCCEIDENGTAKGSFGSTSAYYSPELVDIPPKPRTIQGDMWAMGITLVEVADGKHPCPKSQEYEQFSAIQLWEPKVPETIRLPPLRKLISCLLSREPKQRPQSYAEIHHMLNTQNLANKLPDDDLTFVNRVINMKSSYPTTS
ncbi:unnamed protein product [Rotaria magnacalcarata]|uniref:mitogen-activated protein kinase kinase n=1 Tax=Rotaria magnacalcarata TaxID=392030 RepID=A0A816ZSF1_9BILA|nr:unnamed protein product [Rotaria magnacalcarata]